MQAEAIVFSDKEKVVLQRLEMPGPAAGEILIRTKYSTISVGTEGWILRELFDWSDIPFPFVPGYQRVGLVEGLGEGVSGFEIGERVAATRGTWPGPIPPNSGAHLSLANTPADEVYKLPEGIDGLEASALVVAQVGYNAASRAKFEPGEWVLVCGDGLIGQFAAQAARVRGARVILVGRRPDRLALAGAYSADHVIRNSGQDLLKAVHEYTGGKPVAVVLDSLQSETLQPEYMPLLKRGSGQIVYCGFTPGKTWADMALLQKAELTTHFVSGWNRPRLEATLDLLREGKMRLRPLITHLVPYTRGPEMYRLISAKSEPFLGITLDWQGSL